MSSAVVLNPRSGAVWAVSGHELLSYVDGRSATALDLAAVGLHDGRLVTYDAANDSLWLAHADGVSRIQLSTPVVVDETLRGMPAERIAASPFVVRPSIAAVSSEPLSGNRLGPREIKLGLDAFCYETSCGLPSEYFSRYRLAVTVDGKSAAERFVIDGATRTATYLAAPGSATLVAGHAVDPLGHSSNELSAAKAKAQAAVAHTAPTVALTSPPNNATFAAPASVALTATATGNGATISKVDFYNGSTLLKSVTASPYTYSWTGVAVGSYSLTAKATDSLGSSTTSSTFKIVVNANKAPTVALSSPISGASFIAPASISLAATAADSDGSVAKVDFYNGTTLIKSVTASPYTYSWTNVAAGSYSLTAKATDNLGAVTTSSTATAVVHANVVPTVTLTSPTAGTIYSTQSSVPLSATAADSDGTVAKVEFFSGTTLIGTSTSSPFTASWSGGSAGTYSITAKATDNLGATKTSAAASVTLVNGTAPTVTLLQPQDGSKTTTGAQITLEASVDDPTVTSVAFYSGTKLLKAVNAAPWIYYYSNAPNGTYAFKAVATAGNGLKGTSPTSTMVVASPPPTIDLTSPVADSRYSPGAVIVLTAQPQMVDTTVANVQFYQGSTLLGTGIQNGTTYSYSWSNATSGYYSLVAKLTDSNGVVVSSAPVAIEMMTDACSARDTTSKSAQAMAKTASTATRSVSKTQIPLTFEANEGQADPEVRFQARGRDYGLQLSSSGLHLRAGRGYGSLATKKRLASAIRANGDSAASAAIHMTFVGGNSRAAMAGEGAVDETSNYLVGRDSNKWLLGVPHFSKVRASAVYPGVDALYYGTAGELEYDLIVAAGADPKGIRLGFDGSSKLTLEASGDLIVSNSTTEIRKHKPVAWQTVGGVRHEVAATYVVDRLTVTFKLGQYDARYPLTIDPVISYATQFGSAAGQYEYDSISGIAVDAAGNAYITGTTQAANFSLVDPLQGSIGAATSAAFITKLDPTGSRILYSTYFGGGTGSSEGTKIALDLPGNVYVTGWTTSTDFPTTTGALQTTIGSTGNLADVFVAKLNPSGSALIYSTYVGGSATEEVTGLAVDSAGNAYVAGNTESVDFPVTAAAIQPHLAASAATDSNGFAFKLNSTGSALVYSTYLGGSGDEIDGAALDAAGALYLAGTARSANFPVTAGSFQTLRGGDSDAFVTKISVDGASLVYSTLIGGASSGDTNQTHGGDGATSVAVDGTGAVYVLGTTNSVDFPVLNAYQSTNLQDHWWDNDNNTSGQYRAAFLTRLNPSGSAAVFSTYFGGKGCAGSVCVAGPGDFDIGTADVSVDHAGNAYILVVSSNKGSFPTILPAASGAVGPSGLYLAEFLPSGQPVYSTPLVGGAGSLAVDDIGNAYLAGSGMTAPTPDACEVDGPGKALVMKVREGLHNPGRTLVA